MDCDRVRRDEGLDAGVPARIVAMRAPGGMLIEVAGHDFLAYRSCAVGCRPEPEDLFLAGLVTCAALGLESYLRRQGLPVDQLRLEADIGPTPDGRRRVTLRPPLSFGTAKVDQEAFRRELVAYCARYATSRCDLEVEIDVVAADARSGHLAAVSSAAQGH